MSIQPMSVKSVQSVRSVMSVCKSVFKSKIKENTRK